MPSLPATVVMTPQSIGPIHGHGELTEARPSTTRIHAHADVNARRAEDHAIIEAIGQDGVRCDRSKAGRERLALDLCAPLLHKGREGGELVKMVLHALAARTSATTFLE